MSNFATLVFQIWHDSLHRLRSYCWETARRSIWPIFSVHPVGKTKRWIEKWINLFDGLDELYHRAKFGEDRTTRAGCRCVNMVFVCLPAGLPRSGQLPLLFLLTGQKSGFSPRRGDSLRRFRSNFAGPTAPGSAWLCKISRQSVQRAGNAAPKISKISTIR